ncbi:MAG: NAD(+) diphosphatase [Sphingomonadaceae bacterium]
MTELTPPGLTGSILDRVDHLREDQSALAALRSDPRATILVMDGLDPLLTDDFALAWSPLQELDTGEELALLGFIDDAPRFVALTDAPSGYSRSARVMRALQMMAGEEASTFAAARSLVDWHNRHRFCAQCGGTTVPVRAGWTRRCLSCNAQHFPRTDPVVIMLAEYDGRVLLGRQAQFPASFYSALAGFVEVGESIEEAVARELKEEAGLTISNVRYVASQPWPFPSSLMIACIADAASNAITLDAKEIEEAIWCDRAEVAAALNCEPSARFQFPNRYAIAYTLLRRWADGILG